MYLSPESRSSSPATATVTPFSGGAPFSFLTRTWQEDLQLMRDRASTFKNLASSIDREIEHLITSASSSLSSPVNCPPDLDFVNRIRPKLSALRRAYSSPDFSQSILQKWAPPSEFSINMSSIKEAIVSEVEDNVRLIEGKSWIKGWEWIDEEKDNGSLLSQVKRRLKDFELKSCSSEFLSLIRSSEFMDKLRTTLKSICKQPLESKDVPPFDANELLACLIKQSGPFFDQLGLGRDICDKVVDFLCSKQRDQLLWHTVSSDDAYDEKESMNSQLDLRIANVLQSTGYCYEGDLSSCMKSDFSDERHHVAIVTTACLPWMTGTAINPLFRAAYLSKLAKQKVTLLVPWLCKSDQELVYPDNILFNSPMEQEIYIRDWVEERVGFNTDFRIAFYPGKFTKSRRSIIPAGDTSQFICSKEADIAILEEPEHLNWYHHGKRWSDKFNHVVGVVHTNYLEYIKRERNGILQAFFVKHINNLVTRAHCHKVLRLSAATQEVPKSVVCNVHGVNPKFLKIGEKLATESEQGMRVFSKGAYFLGKMVWAKGYEELIDLFAKHKEELSGFNLDVYGSGQDAHYVQSAAMKLNLNFNFLNARDHSDHSLHGYKVFVNPSVSDVLCTATAEALAMGKFVVCSDHPSNDFFKRFPNCLTYKTSDEFVARVKEAMAAEPQPLTQEQIFSLSWEAATTRFLETSDLGHVLSDKRKVDKRLKKSISLPSLSEMIDGGIALAHYCFTGNEILRLSTGAIPGTRDCDKQQCRDLQLLPSRVQNPIYGW